MQAEVRSLPSAQPEPEIVLTVSKATVLEFIQQLKRVESIATLRRGVLDLQSYLLDSLENSSLIVAQPTELVELHYKYVLEELNQIIQAYTLERAKYYLERFEKSITRIKTSRINDINLNRWKEYQDIYTDSLWLLERRDNSGVHSANYWGNFVPQIPRQMMHRYTKKGEWVLDTFAGSGTTLIESQRMGRNAIGIELQPAVAEQTRQLIATEPNELPVISEIITADSATVNYSALLQKYGQKSAQLLIMHPPYFDIIKFSNDARDLSNAASIQQFLTMMGQVVENAAAVLDKGRYLALVIGDKYAGGEWIPLGFLAMNEVLKFGFTLKSIIVKNFEGTAGKRNQKELWKYRALVGGFYIFKHEYIFVLRKK